ncbi:MAG: hypothetical protein Q9165_007664 [Trypethelium subeluteriae]
MIPGAPPSYNVFEESLCLDSDLNPSHQHTVQPFKLNGSWRLWCDVAKIIQPRPPDRTHNGKCRAKEFCVTKLDPGPESEPIRTAWCVPATCFINLATAAVQTIVRQAEIDREEEQQEQLMLALYEASDLYEAAHMEVESVDSQDDPLGHPISCSSCSTLSYAQTPPDGTTKFRITVKMRSPEDAPDLHVLDWLNDA